MQLLRRCKLVSNIAAKDVPHRGDPIILQPHRVRHSIRLRRRTERQPGQWTQRGRLMPAARFHESRVDSLLPRMPDGSPRGCSRRRLQGLQGDGKGEEYGMGAVESQARCRAWAVDGIDVATGLMVFLLMRTRHGSHNLVEGSFRVAAVPPKT